MTHSINIIADYVCKYYGVTMEQIVSGDRHWNILKPYYMIILLSGLHRDNEIGRVVSRDRSTVSINRKTFQGNMRYNTDLQAEFEDIKQGLLKYEISKT